MRWIVLAVAVVFAVTFVAGMLWFPDAPIRVCGERFCGKYGAVHTEQHFLAYRWWSRAVIAALLLTFAGMVALNIRGE